MGATGSMHLKVDGECYDISHPSGYAGNFDIASTFIIMGPLALLFLLISIRTRSKIAMGLFAFSVVSMLWTVFSDSSKKREFVQKYGKKVECPKPNPQCDEAYKKFEDEKRRMEAGLTDSYQLYSCDKRLMYT